MERWRDFVSGASDSLTVKRVFGEPIERDGTTFVPAASIMGGGGGGEGENGGGADSGMGGGFGLRARPVGAYVIREGKVEWQPALDLLRLGLAGIVLAALFILVAGSVLRPLTSSSRTR